MTPLEYIRLIDIQARMQLKSDSSKFVLGYLWWFLEPVLWVGVFFVVFNLILDSDKRGGIDFIVFLACGKFAFLWFSKTVLQASGSLVANQGMVGKIDLPKTMFPMAVIQESLYRQGAVYMLLFLLIIAFGYPVTLSWLWLPLILAVYYLVIVACSFIGACLVCLVRDFAKVIPLGMTFLLFTSGIFWDVRSLVPFEKAELVLTYNPLAFLIDAHRQILLYDTAPDLIHLFGIGIVAAIGSILMSAFMKRNSQYLALKVLS